MKTVTVVFYDRQAASYPYDVIYEGMTEEKNVECIVDNETGEIIFDNE